MNRTGLDILEADSLEQIKGQCVYPLIAEENREAFKELVRKVFTGEPCSLEFKAIGLKGKPVWLYSSAVPIRDEKGAVAFALSTTADVTERKHAEDALRLSEERFRAVVNSMGDIVYTLDAAQRHTAIYGDWAERLGFSEGRFLGKTTRQIMGADAAVPHESANARALAGETVIYEWFAGAGASAQYFQTSVSPLKDSAGNITGLVGVGRDITGLKRAEQKIRERESQLSKAQKIAHLGHWEWDIAANHLVWSEEVYRIYGLDPDKDVPTYETVVNTIPEALRPRFLSAIDNALKNNSPFEGEYQLIRPDGSVRDTFTTGELVRDAGGNLVKMFGIVQDITERKLAEAELRESEERYRKLVDSSPVPIMVHTDWKIIYVNPSAEKAFGASRETELIGRDALSVVVPEMRKFAEKRISGIYSGRQDAAPPGEAKFLRLDGTAFDVMVSGVPLKFMGMPAAQIMFEDITDRKRAEDALRQSEERYRAIFDKSMVSLWEEDFSAFRKFMDETKAKGVADIAGYLRAHPEEAAGIAASVKIIDVNEATLRLYGAKSKDEFYEGLPKVFTPESYRVFLNGLIALAEGKTYFTSEAENRTLKGKPIHVLISWSIPPGYERSLSRVFVSIVDITDRKLLEEERLKTHKLESVGMLAGGIAHDFNNLLTGVFGNVSLAKLHIGEPERAMEFLASAEKSMKQAKGLTSQLLTFSKGGLPIKRRVAVEKFFRDAVNFALSGSATGCDFDLRADGWLAEMDEAQMTQAVQNIVTNARESMGRGGKMAARAFAAANKGELHNLAPGDYAVFEIEDSGSGIPAEIIGKIFDPYFTTKETGTGLGLAVVYSIVEKHGGAVAVKSEPGKGSTFRIYIPAYRD